MTVKAGFIYVLIHPSDANLLKVGMTTRSPQLRLKEHNTQWDKAAGKIVKTTGHKWILKEFFAVEDAYNAESAFFHRPPLTEIPYMLENEILNIDGTIITWNWINEGLKTAKSVGIRKNILQPPIPKPKPKKSAKWIEAELKDSGLTPLKNYGNGITKVAFKCSQGHIFNISGYSLVRFPFCPICKPECFDAYTLRQVEL